MDETPSSLSVKQATAFGQRYKDAYRVARTVTLVGEFIKALGFLLIIATIVIIYLAVSQSGSGIPLVGAVIGVPIAAFFYLMGVLVSAQGQILKASLDGAVNNSPFLNNKQRAMVMSLPLE